jgi:large subunit ribosomal protein L7/L12
MTEILEQVGKLGDDEKNSLILSIVEKMSVLNLSKLVKAVEERFGVKAATGGGMMMMPGMMPGAGGADDEPAEPTEFDVVLTEIGQSKIPLIKEVRAITGLGLKEAKELVDKAPIAIKEKVSAEEAEKFKGQLVEAGGTVEVKASGSK